MAKIFAVSDIHGYYNELIEALSNAGFEPNNPDHLLVCCGDYFDRGEQPKEVMDFLMGIGNKVLIRGNHEQLLEELCDRHYPHTYDIHNGTFRTIALLSESFVYDYAYEYTRPFFAQMVNYFETENYIFVHSWIPVTVLDSFPKHYIKNREFCFNPNWREAHQSDWENAMWGNPFDMADKELFPDKKIVFGHWHCSAGWARSKGISEFGEDACFDIYEEDKFVSIDGCTAHTGKVNVFVLEDNLIS